MTAANECVLRLLSTHVPTAVLKCFLPFYSVCSVQGGARCEYRGSSQALGALFLCLVTKSGHSFNREGSSSRAATFGKSTETSEPQQLCGCSVTCLSPAGSWTPAVLVLVVTLTQGPVYFLGDGGRAFTRSRSPGETPESPLGV